MWRLAFVFSDIFKRALSRAVQGTLIIAALVSAASPSFGQDTLALSSGTAAANGAATLNLSLTSPTGSEPAGLQWTLTYSPGDIVSMSAVAGTSATTAGKSLTCSASSGSYADRK